MIENSTLLKNHGSSNPFSCFFFGRAPKHETKRPFPAQFFFRTPRRASCQNYSQVRNFPSRYGAAAGKPHNESKMYFLLKMGAFSNVMLVFSGYFLCKLHSEMPLASFGSFDNATCDTSIFSFRFQKLSRFEGAKTSLSWGKKHFFVLNGFLFFFWGGVWKEMQFFQQKTSIHLYTEATATPLVAMQFPEAKKTGKRRNEEPRVQMAWLAGCKGLKMLKVESWKGKMLVMNRGFEKLDLKFI